MSAYRTEQDLLGEISVPAHVLYGAQTQRALENFPPHNQPRLGDFPHLVDALVQIKHAAASTNVEIGAISAKQGEVIRRGAEKVIHEKLYREFPIHYLHGGGGTSANMNANEVLANLGEETLGGRRGNYEHIHPNNHVNLHQSTNDVYPTACHLAIIEGWRQLDPAFQTLETTLREKIAEIGFQPRLARTCLQDSVGITYGDFLGGYLESISRNRVRLERAVSELERVNLGGTIVGRSSDVPPEYFEKVVEKLDSLFPNSNIRRSHNLYDAAQNLDDLVAVSGSLETVARSLIKICKDLRLLASGPEGGLGEIVLPALQPGSSIMPGKVNPVMPEFVIQVGFRIIGNYHMSAMAIDHGELDLNVWESPVVFAILESMDLLGTALRGLSKKCLAGMTAPEWPNSERANSLIVKLTELAKIHGYSRISDLCKKADGDFGRIRELLRQEGFDT